MKLFLLVTLIINLFATEIILENCNLKKLNLDTIPKKYYENLYTKGPFDTKPQHYTGITLKNLQKIIGKSNKLTFIAYDDYKVTFKPKEIDSSYIYFVFLQNNKPIPISKRGPAKIIYTKKDQDKNYFFKSIFLIKKVICER